MVRSKHGPTTATVGFLSSSSLRHLVASLADCPRTYVPSAALRAGSGLDYVAAPQLGSLPKIRERVSP